MTSPSHSDDDLIGLLRASAGQAEPLDLDARVLARAAMRRGRTRRALQAGGGVLAAAAVAGGAWLYGTHGTTPLPADPAPSVSPTPAGRPTAGPFADDPTMARLPVLDGVRPGVVPEGWVPHEVSGLRLAVPDGWSEVPKEAYPGDAVQADRYTGLWRQDETMRLAGPGGARVIAAESARVASLSPDNPPRGHLLREQARVLFPVTGSDLAVASLQGRFYDGMALDSAEIQLRAADGRGYVVVATGLDALEDPDTLVKLLGTLTLTHEAHRPMPVTDVPLWEAADQGISEGWQTLREGNITVAVPEAWTISDGRAYGPTPEFLSFGRLFAVEPMSTAQAQHRLETPGAEAVLVSSDAPDHLQVDQPMIRGQVDIRLPSGEIVTIVITLRDDEDGATLFRQMAGTVRVDP
ncbi:hypothetical protein [Myceligenerans pegani]|uniref:Uncharacterized protein n=1 Tax=Myceligenerans pegani TaxID=2776917 RepID=A0ABR9MYZ8_9MICO|nr:hypothetical protein [Myceligenerans sp. TRM 65318]MBE1876159.1 hypothetical protein [Myceligenerans sp. TRM 65318]MBE3018430.1 hypothetical protein [Myceligenerans sp. TRM 65318]